MKSFVTLSIAMLVYVCSFQTTFAQHVTGSLEDHVPGHGNFKPRPAPIWEMVDFNGDATRSSTFHGKPCVMVFFQGHGCLHCSQQLQALGNRMADFDKQGIGVVAVSTDSQKDLAKSVENYDGVLPFRNLLSDEKLDVFKSFGVFDEKENSALHATVILDSNGIIRWETIGHKPFMDDHFVFERTSRLVTSPSIQDEESEPVKRPKIFLDRSERIVKYQLGRLDNEKLLLVERQVTDQKYLPVYQAILGRSGMSPQYRIEALNAIVEINKSDQVSELVAVLNDIKLKNRQQRQTAKELGNMLVQIPAKDLAQNAENLKSGRDSKNEILKSVSYAALTIAGQEDLSWNFAKSKVPELKSWLASMQHIKNPQIKGQQRERILQLIGEDQDNEIRIAAIDAIASIPGKESETFASIAKLITNPELRNSVISALLQIPAKFRDAKSCRMIVEHLTDIAEATPAAERTSDNFSKAMQLADQMLVQLPSADAKAIRARLSEVSVRVVRILTIEDEMRYDTPFFAVEAGRPVQVVLENDDFVSHNLVITKPGALKEVAALGLATGPKNGLDGKAYVPDSDLVLHATGMLAAYKHEAMTFTAPSEPGDYPFVCTFPQHWPRMYGVMVVVKDLDAWLKNPIAPKDPIGSNRKFVKSWTVNDLEGDLESGLKGRSNDIGKRIFSEATCLQCHKLGPEGGEVGPNLNDVVKRWKGDRKGILREILEPSHKIDEKYSMHMILTLDGDTITGIIQKQDDEKIELIDNPESEVLRAVLKDDIDEMVKSSKSIMPKALMDRFTKDEILELMAYIESNQQE